MKNAPRISGVLAAALISFAFSSLASVRILPLGDSITQGDSRYDSYRYPLWLMLRAGGYDVDFVGTLTDPFDDTEFTHDSEFDTDHEGHWGWTTGEVLAALPEWLAAYTADIALIHLGTNNFGDPGAIGDLEAIIDTLRSDNPDVTVLLAQIIPIGWSGDGENDIVAPFNKAIGEIPARKSTSRSPVIVVDQHTGFNATEDTWDGVHPDSSGQVKMAAKWYEALVPLLTPLSARILPNGIGQEYPSFAPRGTFDPSGRMVRGTGRGTVIVRSGKVVIGLHTSLVQNGDSDAQSGRRR